MAKFKNYLASCMVGLVVFAVCVFAPHPSWAQESGNLFGMWTGHYVCAPIDTAATVRIISVSKYGDLSATFSFSSLPGMSLPLPGSFRLTGRYDANTAAVTFQPAGWIQPPADPRYRMDGFSAILDPVARTMIGNMLPGGVCNGGRILLEKGRSQ